MNEPTNGADAVPFPKLFDDPETQALVARYLDAGAYSRVIDVINDRARGGRFDQRRYYEGVDGKRVHADLAVLTTPRTGWDLWKAPFPPIAWGVEGVFVAGTGQVVIVHGEAGCGKTTAALQMAIACVRGTPWIGRTTTALDGNVALLLSETNARFWQARTARIDPDFGEIATRFPLVWCAEDEPRLEAPGAVDELMARCRAHDIGMVILDNLSSLWPSGKLASADGDAGIVMDAARRLANDGDGRLVVPISHDRKASSTGRAGGDLDQLLGDSRFGRAVDSAVRLDPHSSGAVRFATSKCRDGARSEWWGRMSEGGIFLPVEAPDASGNRASRLEAIVSILATTPGLDREGIAEALGTLGHRIKERTIQGDLADLKRAGRVHLTGHGPATKYQTIPQASEPARSMRDTGDPFANA